MNSSFEGEAVGVSVPTVDADLHKVKQSIQRRLGADVASAFARAVRTAFDVALRGMHTGRWSIAELSRTEKTHVGLFVEFETRELLACPEGAILDLLVDGLEVDVKFSTNMWKWEFPSESIGHICLIVHADENAGALYAGLLRVEDYMLGAKNKDGKRKLLAGFRSRIIWLVDRGTFGRGFFAELPETLRGEIFAAPKGQPRVNKLFELTAGRIVPRYAIATVGLQHDSMRRARGGDGGTQKYLWQKGLFRLGGKYERKLINLFGVATLKSDEYIVLRISDFKSPKNRRLIEQYRRKKKLPAL